MRLLTLLLLTGVSSPAAATVAPAPAAAKSPAVYVVRLAQTSPPRFVVTATWPAGTRLEMDTTRPGDLPELGEQGWPVLVTRLRVTDAAGRFVQSEKEGAAGWRLPVDAHGPFTAEYEVDTRLLAEHGWPAPREAVFMDGETVSLVGRSLFITTDGASASTVKFELPAGWQPYAPWDPVGGQRDGMSFHVRSAERLRENLIVLARSAPTVVEAAGFRVVVVPMGPWRALEPEVGRVLHAHARHFVDLMGFRGTETYLALLLPLRNGGAESYRQSLALTFGDEPSRTNQAAWANLIGHELFHYWNGWRLQGAEYRPFQWFQEGFTEYAANVSTAAAGLMTPAEFRDKLAQHVANYRKLETSLEDYGTTKGPPLYSAGTLVAFEWDVAIREVSNGTRRLGDFLRDLSRRCGDGDRPYSRDDLIAALNETAKRDWDSFLDAHVRGRKPLPLQETFTRAGLRLTEAEDGTVSVVEDPDAGAQADRIWRKIMNGE